MREINNWLVKSVFAIANQTWEPTWEYNLRMKFLTDTCF